MIIYPAIDIIDGKCVRLSRGDYSNKTIYSDNLEEIERDWIVKGTNQLHLHYYPKKLTVIDLRVKLNIHE